MEPPTSDDKDPNVIDESATWSLDSRRGYVTRDEVEEYGSIVLNDTIAYDTISHAEEIIDGFIGFQQKFFPLNLRGEVTSADANTIYDISEISQLIFPDGFYIGCEIEIIGGTGRGQRRIVNDSIRGNKDVTVTVPWKTVPDSTSFFHIYQLGKFPRFQDVFINPLQTRYYKSIPEEVKRGTAAQVEYMLSKGEAFFAGDDITYDSQRIGNWAGTRGHQSASVRLMAPKAIQILQGIKNRGGHLIVDNPTSL